MKEAKKEEKKKKVLKNQQKMHIDHWMRIIGISPIIKSMGRESLLNTKGYRYSIDIMVN